MEAFLISVTVFVLAVFVGFEIITKIPSTLHTPLMSGSNAISGIAIVGALVAAGGAGHEVAKYSGAGNGECRRRLPDHKSHVGHVSA